MNVISHIYQKSEREIVICFTHRPDFTLYSDECVFDLLDEFLCPVGSRARTLTEHIEMLDRCEEDTLVIELGEVA